MASNGNNRQFVTFLTGLGIGIGLTLLFAPQSGEETREWIAAQGTKSLKRVRKQGKRSLSQLQRMIEQSEDQATRALRASKEALDSLTSKLT